jgi:hypothetical protein
LIDANTVLPPLLTTNVSNLKPNIVKAELEPEVAIETSHENNLLIAVALVIMNQLKPLWDSPHQCLVMESLQRQTLWLIRQPHLTLLVKTLLWLMVSIKIVRLFLSYLFEWLVSSASLRLRCFVLRFLPLMDRNSPTYNLESYLTSKVGILCWDYHQVGSSYTSESEFLYYGRLHNSV